ncbi:MAG: glutamine synthetase, partial [Proteobacteria bacterium]|nr:glutamine synthetase [Pseudomonadota bacterium]
AADAAANPDLALGAIVRAGLEGLRAELPTPEITRADPGTLSEAERARHGVARLPQSLEQALDALESDGAACGWFPAPLLDAYLRHKRAEIEIMAGLDRDQRCARYAEAY